MGWGWGGWHFISLLNTISVSCVPEKRTGTVGITDVSGADPVLQIQHGTATMVRQTNRRRAPAVKAGYSQLHWMRLCTEQEDLTDGVGLADPDDEDGWPTFTVAQVRQHNTRDDAWMVLRGRVYNVTRYMEYHPGSVEEIMRAAGDDATALFHEVHPWVNAEGMLEACCVGKLAMATPTKALPRRSIAGTAVGTALDPDEYRPFTVSATRPAGDDSVLLRFALPEGVRLGLSVGEFVHVVAADAGPQAAERAYTPVSDPGDEGSFELLVRACVRGKLSPRLADATEGSVFQMRGPRCVSHAHTSAARPALARAVRHPARRRRSQRLRGLRCVRQGPVQAAGAARRA